MQLEPPVAPDASRRQNQVDGNGRHENSQHMNVGIQHVPVVVYDGDESNEYGKAQVVFDNVQSIAVHLRQTVLISRVPRVYIRRG